MRAEGDIANFITSATAWRRIGIVGEETGGVVLTGLVFDAESTELEQFLTRNNYPFQFVKATAETLSDHNQSSDRDFPLPSVKLLNGRTIHRPTITPLADELGLSEFPDPKTIYDVIVVGAGPSGLAAAVYPASERLSTLVLESIAPGGQAGTSSMIENYLGLPTGISGHRLASRAHMQALKFGVRFAISRETIASERIGDSHRLTLSGGICEWPNLHRCLHEQRNVFVFLTSKLWVLPVCFHRWLCVLIPDVILRDLKNVIS